MLKQIEQHGNDIIPNFTTADFYLIFLVTINQILVLLDSIKAKIFETIYLYYKLICFQTNDIKVAQSVIIVYRFILLQWTKDFLRSFLIAKNESF